MSSSGGYFKLHRSLFGSPEWASSTAIQKAILITILGMAQWRAEKVEYRKKEFKLKPGQFVASLTEIAKKAGQEVDRQTVRYTLARLEKLGFLTTRTTKKRATLVTIKNWSKWQVVETEETKSVIPQFTTQNENQIKGRASKEEPTTQTELEKLFPQKLPQFTTQKGVTLRKEESKEENSNSMPNIDEVSISKDVVREIWEFYTLHLARCGVKLTRKLNDSRRDIIKRALRRGHTPGELRKAIENTWYPNSHWLYHKYFDLVYAIGQRKGIDNVDARQERQGVPRWDDVGPRRRGRKVGSRLKPNPKRKNRFENE